MPSTLSHPHQLLLAHGAPLFMKNTDQKTACDLAVEGKQLIISKLLESKMVLVQVRCGCGG